MVAQTAALRCEEIVTDLQCLNHIVEMRNGNTANFRQFLYIRTESSRILDSHCLIGTPCGNDLDFETVFTALFVVFERIDRVVGRTNSFYVIATHEVACGIFFGSQLGVALIVNLACRSR